MFITDYHYVYINSRERVSGTENFTYNIAFPDGIDFTHVVCLNALIPKSYYLIQDGSGENVFQLQEDDVIVTITVPIGSHTRDSFKIVISGLLTANSPNGLSYALSYSPNTGPSTGKWTYTQSNHHCIYLSHSVFFQDQRINSMVQH
ncbi:MAG TPA: hypothetical protein PLS50_01645 [Candidatus Dojkabacteria bacterium]|nr:hypothetical protein [Candidatus Dojkabacteria bacterium]